MFSKCLSYNPFTEHLLSIKHCSRLCEHTEKLDKVLLFEVLRFSGYNRVVSFMTRVGGDLPQKQNQITVC